MQRDASIAVATLKTLFTSAEDVTRGVILPRLSSFLTLGEIRAGKKYTSKVWDCEKQIFFANSMTNNFSLVELVGNSRFREMQLSIQSRGLSSKRAAVLTKRRLDLSVLKMQAFAESMQCDFQLALSRFNFFASAVRRRGGIDLFLLKQMIYQSKKKFAQTASQISFAKIAMKNGLCEIAQYETISSVQ